MSADSLVTGKKQLLCLMYYFPPMGGVPVMRSLRITRYLPKHDWKPIVVTCSGGFDAIHGLDGTLLSRVSPELTVTRIQDPLGRLLAKLRPKLRNSTWRYTDRVSKLLFLPDEKILWGMLVFLHVRKTVKRGRSIDAIYATGFPWTSFLIGAFLKRVCRRPLILDFRDAWTLNPSPLWRYFKLHGLLEKMVLNRADRIIFSTESTKTAYQHKYPAFAKKMATIYNGYDPSDFRTDTNKLTIRRPGGTRELTLCYTGSLSDNVPGKPHSQSLAPFLAGLSEIRSVASELYEQIRVEVFSNDVPATKKYARDLGLERMVSFHSRVPYAEVLRIIERADGLLLIVMRGSAARQIVPAKLYEYIASGKPILAISPRYSESAKLVEMYNLGIVVDYDNLSNGLAPALNALLFEEKWKERNGRLLEAQRIFDGERLVAELAGLLDDLTQPLPSL